MSNSGGGGLKGALTNTLADLKAFRRVLVKDVNETQERLSKIPEQKEKCEKLKYQMDHLRRSLKLEER